ncbi:uncharacterized protein N7458_000678 [Penicillium daleae]|uniref:S-adenosyl-L-methionine-dependent methyltransferase n=1 Tax=Penicillium daleae TaxID=63821 RepID=A0AAD6CI89_9EURO|nr:uncharacterized protein N7458_000678 [Penicillium daleae]KAJ5464992.1 hypothetical protein N7458_000678 [Penicillium daleae]
MNSKAIGDHYSRGDDFYLTYIDKRYRFYSHGLFKYPDESIEEVSEHKLESMFSSLELKPGQRLLDIGGGWGGVTQYCGARAFDQRQEPLGLIMLLSTGSPSVSQTTKDLLKPGGRVYLDVSAAVTKFAVSSWARQYIWSGTHSFITVQDVMAEFLYHGFEVIEVVHETKDYELTMLEWTKRLDAAKDEVIAGWGEETYRVFRLVLWGWDPCI